jgi:hypothetical protein
MAAEAGASPDRSAETLAVRKFGLFDAMVLLAGLALALATGVHLVPLLADSFISLCRAVLDERERQFANWSSYWKATHDHVRNTLWYGFQIVFALLLGLSLSYFVLRLRRPRPALRALLTQPGTVAVLAIVFGLLWVTGLIHILFPGRIDSLTGPAIAVGGTVAVAWFLLALSRRWHAEPGWVDRLGRLLGAAALAAALLGVVIDRI